MTVDRTHAAGGGFGARTTPGASSVPDGSVGAVGTEAATLKIAIIGPSRPAGDSAAEHTTSLANHLAEAGYEVSLVTWVGLTPSGPKPARGTEPSGLPDGRT
ncbi:MAG: hypothetical protein ABIZ07_00785 [Dermatophilaceae bacterium]